VGFFFRIGCGGADANGGECSWEGCEKRSDNVFFGFGCRAYVVSHRGISSCTIERIKNMVLQWQRLYTTSSLKMVPDDVESDYFLEGWW
jgi:hypothetical protein